VVIDLDGNGGGDWIKGRSLDWPLCTEQGMLEWMETTGVTPEKLRTMALFSERNRQQYPWLDKLAGLARES
jgi:hypothetical protein